MKTKRDKYFSVILLFLAVSFLAFLSKSANAETTICNDDSQCTSGQKCITIVGTSSKTCRTPLANGELCSFNGDAKQCASGNCRKESEGIARCAYSAYTQGSSGSANQSASPTGTASGAGSCIYDASGECIPDPNGSSATSGNVGKSTPSSSANTGNTYSTNPYNAGSYGFGSSATINTVNCDSGTLVSGVCIPINTGLPSQSVQTIVVNLMNWLLGIFAVIGVIAFLISGIQYLVAAGDSKIMETAKRNMIYSIIGILVGLSGLIVMRAVMSLFSANPLI